MRIQNEKYKYVLQISDEYKTCISMPYTHLLKSAAFFKIYFTIEFDAVLQFKHNKYQNLYKQPI